MVDAGPQQPAAAPAIDGTTEAAAETTADPVSSLDPPSFDPIVNPEVPADPEPPAQDPEEGAGSSETIAAAEEPAAERSLVERVIGGWSDPVGGVNDADAGGRVEASVPEDGAESMNGERSLRDRLADAAAADAAAAEDAAAADTAGDDVAQVEEDAVVEEAAAAEEDPMLEASEDGGDDPEPVDLEEPAGEEHGLAARLAEAEHAGRESEDDDDDEKRSRYARRSAKLPRIGKESGGSVFSSLSGLRKPRSDKHGKR
jgi:hypothetical protein